MGSLGCACTRGDACDPGLTCVADLCVDVDTTSTSTGTTTGTTTTTTTGELTTADPTTDPTSTTTSDSEGADCDPKEGALNPACPDAFPYCSASGVCGDCTILVSCAGVDINKGVCDLDTGACVQCNAAEAEACKGDTPVCDLESNTCVACTSHAQCVNSACDLALGQCLPASNVISVLPDDPVNGLCTTSIGGDKPYCNAEVAIQHMHMHGISKGWTVRLLKGPNVLSTLNLTTAGKPAVVAIIGYDDPTLAAELQGGVPIDFKGPGLTVYLDNLDIVSTAILNDPPNVRCDSATLDLSNTRIRQGVGPGLRGAACTVNIRDSVISRNKSEGIELTGGALFMRNSFVTENGQNGIYGGGAIRLQNVSAVDIAYTTLLNNLGAPGKGATIHCEGNNNVGSIRASVLGAAVGQENPSISCSTLFVEQSILDGGDFMADASNHAMSTSAVLDLFAVDIPYSIYRWKKPPAESPTTWQSDDPRVDFEGDPRSVTVGAPESPGADVYSQ